LVTGLAVGSFEGDTDGPFEGDTDGSNVGLADGEDVITTGALVGLDVGFAVVGLAVVGLAVVGYSIKKSNENVYHI